MREGKLRDDDDDDDDDDGNSNKDNDDDDDDDNDDADDNNNTSSKTTTTTTTMTATVGLLGEMELDLHAVEKRGTMKVPMFSPRAEDATASRQR